MGKAFKRVLKIAILAGIVYVFVFVPIDGKTPYEHATKFVKEGIATAKDSVKLDDGHSPYPDAPEGVPPEDQGETYSASQGQNNPTRGINKKIQDSAKKREQRRQRRQQGWQ